MGGEIVSITAILFSPRRLSFSLFIHFLLRLVTLNAIFLCSIVRRISERNKGYCRVTPLFELLEFIAEGPEGPICLATSWEFRQANTADVNFLKEGLGERVGGPSCLVSSWKC